MSIAGCPVLGVCGLRLENTSSGDSSGHERSDENNEQGQKIDTGRGTIESGAFEPGLCLFCIVYNMSRRLLRRLFVLANPPNSISSASREQQPHPQTRFRIKQPLMIPWQTGFS